MRTWIKWIGAIAAAGVCASSAMAADHRDGSGDTDGVKAEPEADINDVFTFMDGDDLVLIGSIGGLQAAGGGTFSDAVQYVFHIGRTDSAAAAVTVPPIDVTRIVCEFDSGSTTNLTCSVGTPGEEATATVSGDASANTGIENDDGTLTVHAGEHKDPFFFYLPGLVNAFTHVNTLTGGDPSALTTDESGCPDLTGTDPLEDTGAVPADATISATLLGMLNGSWDATGVATTESDTFLDNNVSALVVKISPDHLAGEGDFFQVYMSTHKKP